MPDYSQGKIYKITSSNGLPYIGSTTVPLNERFSVHKSKHKLGLNTTSNNHMDADDVKIELIEAFPCSTRDELFFRERYFMETMECCNRCIPISTEDEREAKQKEYDRRRYKRDIENGNHRGKRWREANSTIINCDCGSSIVKYKLKRHLSTNGHLNYILSMERNTKV